MSRRPILSGLIVGLLLAGAAFAPSARGDPPAVSEIDKRAGRSITLAGVVEVDETKVVRVRTRLKAHIDKLHKVAGQQLERGEPLAELSSRELRVVTEMLLDAQRRDNDPGTRLRTELLEPICREHLQLWGMDKDQIEAILKSGEPTGRLTLRSPVSGHVLRKHQVEGNRIDEGTLLFDVIDLSTVWIDAEIKAEADAALLRARLPVRVTTRAIANREFSGELLFLFRDANSPLGLKVRFAVKNPRNELLPGMLALVQLDVPAAPRAGPPDKKDAKLEKLLGERLATLRTLVKVTEAAYLTGKVSFDRLHQATRAMLHAELELCKSDKEKIAVLEKVVTLAKNYEESARQRYKAGAVTQGDVLMATAARLEGEIALERAKAKAPARPGAGKPSGPAGQLGALKQEYQRVQEEYSRAYREAKTEGERQKARDKERKQTQASARRAVELARKAGSFGMGAVGRGSFESRVLVEGGVGVAQLDADATLQLLAVRVRPLAGQALGERRLPVVDVPDHADVRLGLARGLHSGRAKWAGLLRERAREPRRRFPKVATTVSPARRPISRTIHAGTVKTRLPPRRRTRASNLTDTSRRDWRA